MAGDEVEYPEWVTCAQACRKLKCSRSRVERLALHRFIATEQFGSRVFYKAMDVAVQAVESGVGTGGPEGFGPPDDLPDSEARHMPVNGFRDLFLAESRSRGMR
jgi:hypothetical protein